MKYPQQKNVRREWHNYSLPAAYFMTINVHRNRMIFGSIENGHMIFNEYGRIADHCWLEIPAHYSSAKLPKYRNDPKYYWLIQIRRIENNSSLWIFRFPMA